MAVYIAFVAIAAVAGLVRTVLLLRFFNQLLERHPDQAAAFLASAKDIAPFRTGIAPFQRGRDLDVARGS